MFIIFQVAVFLHTISAFLCAHTFLATARFYLFVVICLYVVIYVLLFFPIFIYFHPSSIIPKHYLLAIIAMLFPTIPAIGFHPSILQSLFLYRGIVRRMS